MNVGILWVGISRRRMGKGKDTEGRLGWKYFVNIHMKRI
jgi:hypothetical protein